MESTARHHRPDGEPRSAVLAEAVRRAHERAAATGDARSYQARPDHCIAP
jgi:hypothetical protein